MEVFDKIFNSSNVLDVNQKIAAFQSQTPEDFFTLKNTSAENVKTGLLAAVLSLPHLRSGLNLQDEGGGGGGFMGFFQAFNEVMDCLLLVGNQCEFAKSMSGEDGGGGAAPVKSAASSTSKNN